MTLNFRAKMQHFTYFRQPSKNLAHLQCSCLNRFWFADFWRENSKYLLFFAICINKSHKHKNSVASPCSNIRKTRECSSIF